MQRTVRPGGLPSRHATYEGTPAYWVQCELGSQGFTVFGQVKLPVSVIYCPFFSNAVVLVHAKSVFV